MLISYSKKEAYIELVASLNDMLSILPTEGEVNFEDTKWFFKNSRGFIEEIDFSFFSEYNFPSWSNNVVNYLDVNFDLNFEYYVKLIFLQINDGSYSAHVYSDRIQSLKLFFYYLQSVNIKCLDKKHAIGFFSLMINFDITNERPIKRLSPAPYKSRIISFNQKKISSFTLRFRAKPLIEKDIVNCSNKYLNKACISTIGITLNDYQQGGSLNFLGLEVGKHYVDHCANIFQEHLVYAAACRKVLKNIYEIRSFEKRSVKLAICGSLFMGLDPIDSITSKKKKPEEFSEFIKEVKAAFITEANLLIPYSFNTDLSFINEVLSHLNLPDRYDNQEFIRSLLFTLLEKKTDKAFISHLEEYKSLLKESGTPLELSNENVRNILKRMLKKNQLKKGEFTGFCQDNYKKILQKTADSGAKGLQLLIYVLGTVEAAGCTLFIALTGWRGSEYGFPFSSVKVSLNTDALDNAYTPYRVHVNWVVPKTSADTKLDREITFGSYLLLKQMNRLVLAQANEPCLYSFNQNQEKASSFSGASIYRAVVKPWFKFPFEYKLFKDIKNGKECGLEREEIRSLNIMVENLLDDLPRFEFLLLKPEGLDCLHKKIKAFKNGTLPEKFVKIIQKYISSKTIKFIMENDSFSTTMMQALSKEMKGDSLRPTPHAFRHMWAEAVLLRYRGDVGKFIRANFKHLDEGFFMAYLRDKETKFVKNIAKRAVISSIVREQMTSARMNNSSYAGGFERFISKAARITNVLSHNEFIRKTENIANQRVIDIKSTPWATCMLRIGTLNSAKCSDRGEPQRHNASPRLCLGCINANIGESNFNGIVVYIKSDIEACREPLLPYFVKKYSITTLELALKRVTELNNKKYNLKYVNFIEYVKKSIELAEVTRVEELKRE